MDFYKKKKKKKIIDLYTALIIANVKFSFLRQENAVWDTFFFFFYFLS